MSGPSLQQPGDLAVSEQARSLCDGFRRDFAALRTEIARIIVGQDEVVMQTLVGLFADGHVLLEGVPGLGKTLLVRTLADALDLPFSRIQFTPDLMPADIVGTNVVLDNPETRKRTIQFRPGPIFSQIILADEINRATPKTQSALLEAMQERRVTVAGRTYPMKRPFLVLATQNPIEQEGTFTLPEAQLDRFLLKIIVPYAQRSELRTILDRTTEATSPEGTVQRMLSADRIIAMQRIVPQVVAAEHVTDWVIRLVLATNPLGADTPAVSRRYIRVGVSPRGAQALILAAKVMAVIEGRYAISFADIKRAAPAALRHRIIVNFEAEADGVTSDDVIAELLRVVPHEPEDAPWLSTEESAA